MRKLLLVTLLLLSAYSFAQNYSYRFKGKLDESLMTQLENELTSNPGIKNVKFRMKENSGELFFQYVKDNSSKEGQNDDSIIRIKSILLSKGLEPIELVELAR